MYKINHYLKEINTRIIYLLFSFLLTNGLFYFFIIEFYYILTQFFSSKKLGQVILLPNVTELPFSNNSLSSSEFIFTDVTEAFQTSIFSIILFSFLIHFPFLIYHIWSFLSPSFFKKEKKTFSYYSVFFLCQYFLSNFFIIYLIFPILWDFFFTFEIKNNFLNIHSEIRLSSYISFLLKTLLISHFFFQIPFFISVLLKIKILKILDLKKIFSKKKYLYWCVILFCALLAPPDFFIQFSISIFFFVVLEISFFLILLFSKYQLTNKTGSHEIL